MLTSYNTVDLKSFAHSLKYRGREVRIETIWRLIPPGDEVVYLWVPDPDWDAIYSVCTELKVDLIVVPKLISYGERELLLRGKCPKGEASVQRWYQGGLKASIDIYHVPSKRKLDTVLLTGFDFTLDSLDVSKESGLDWSQVQDLTGSILRILPDYSKLSPVTISNNRLLVRSEATFVACMGSVIRQLSHWLDENVPRYS